MEIRVPVSRVFPPQPLDGFNFSIKLEAAMHEALSHETVDLLLVG